MSTETLTPIENLSRQLRERFPEGRVSLDPPANIDGMWFLDVECNDHPLVVAWQKGFGFGVSCSPEHAYGERADEVYQDLEATYSRVLSLLISRTYTAPPRAVQLRELRKERGVSQENLADALNVRQAAVSKLERRKDMLISSVRQVVRSMGGNLRIIAQFPDGMERTLEFDEDDAVAE